MLIKFGLYQFRPKRLAFRNDYCLNCGKPNRSILVQTLDVLYFLWIPVLPLGHRKRWFCSVCGHQPHVATRTRRPFKWLGLAVLAVLTAFLWAAPPDPGSATVSWIFRICAPICAILLLVHLVRSPKDVSLKDRLAGIQPAADTACPFCGTPLMVLASGCSCPTCGVIRV